MGGCFKSFVLATLVAFVSAAGSGPLVNTTSGMVVGSASHSETGVPVHAFWGIPFAQPPVGELRFRPPRLADYSHDPVDASAPAPKCPQFHLVKRVFEGQEDCLTVDVYTPANATSTSRLPVLVFIYGGGYVVGGSWSSGHYDGRNLAITENVVVVSVQYRINVFGFLALPELQQEQPDGTTGNYGLQDQRLALQWVQDNIVGFGGDPDAVTLFGESAGGISICVHMTSPASKGLFHHAIVESGVCDSGMFYSPLDQAIDFGLDYAKHVGCGHPNDRLACLRNATTDHVLQYLLTLFPHVHLPTAASSTPVLTAEAIAAAPALLPLIGFVPAIDGADSGVVDLPAAMVKRGVVNVESAIMGTNKDEGSAFVLLAPLVCKVLLPMSNTAVSKALAHFFDAALVTGIMAEYPEATYSNNEDRLAAIMRDFMFACPTRYLSRALAEHGVPTYMYHFNYTLRWMDTRPLGDYHTSELDFVFGTHSPLGTHTFDAADAKVSMEFMRFWAGLARHGYPAEASLWPQYNTTTDISLAIDVPLRLETGLYRNQCDFWDLHRNSTRGVRFRL